MTGVRGAALDRGGHLYAFSLATSDFLSIGVPAVRQDLDLVDFQHLLCRHGHGVQHATVVGIVVDVVMKNQPALYVRHALEIVRRRPAARQSRDMDSPARSGA